MRRRAERASAAASLLCNRRDPERRRRAPRTVVLDALYDRATKCFRPPTKRSRQTGVVSEAAGAAVEADRGEERISGGELYQLSATRAQVRAEDHDQGQDKGRFVDLKDS